MDAVQVDGNDVEAVYAAASAAATRARGGGGPTFIECKTYRHRGHSRTDPAKYRDPEEVEAWLKRDPLALYRGRADRQRACSTDDEADAIIVEDRAPPAKAAADARRGRAMAGGRRRTSWP